MVQGTRNKVQGTRRPNHKTQFNCLKTLVMSQELEIRFHNFSKRVRDFCLELKWNIINSEYIKQVIRSSGSVAANYIEASDDLGKLDEKMKIKIARRESKESIHWLDLVLTYENKELEKERMTLIDEAEQIKRILSAIINKLDQ